MTPDGDDIEHPRNIWLPCPVCTVPIAPENVMVHLMLTHPEFFTVWMSIVSPFHTHRPMYHLWDLTERARTQAYADADEYNDNILQDINLLHDIENRQLYYDQLFDNPFLLDDQIIYNEHQDLLDLCDEIGYEYIGVDSIERAAPIIDVELAIKKECEKCPICLETWEQLNEQSVESGQLVRLRQTASCKHIFCATCIETWLNKHKKCPLCCTDCNFDEEVNVQCEVETRTDYIASMSISSSPEPSSSASLSSDSDTDPSLDPLRSPAPAPEDDGPPSSANVT